MNEFTRETFMNFLDAGDTTMTLYAEPEPVRLIGVGKSGYVLAKWPDGTVETIPFDDVKEVNVRV